MQFRRPFIALAFLPLFAAASHADVKVVAERNRAEKAAPGFKFPKVPAPSKSDAATKAAFTIVDGRRDFNGGNVDRLHDGQLPGDEDEPSQNFFFAARTEGGRLLVNLGSAIEIQQVNTYSWHPTTRGPQVYKLYASAGNAEKFDARPGKGADPESCGWKLVARVDTRPEAGTGGGQHGVSISDSGGALGKYRYLLFEISRTEAADPFGNTFYSEIDVVAPGSPVVAATTYAPPTPSEAIAVEAAGGKYCITIDTSETPDLTEWATKELGPVVKVWYPKIVELLPSEGYEAPGRVSISFSSSMRGVAATGGTRIRCAARWYRQNLKGEAKGSVVHELVHVVQRYGRVRRGPPGATRPPGWLVEGIADYIRWFLYEPESRGAEITRRNLSRARYDASYRVSANFLNWVTKNHDRDIVRKLNAACREGKYNENLWKKYSGLTVQELGAAWKKSLEKKLAPNDSGAGGA